MEEAPTGIEKMDDVEKVFKRIDGDGDGKISAAELGGVVRALDSNVSEEELKSMIEEMDANRDGFVDLEEFAQFHRAGNGLDPGSTSAKGEMDLKDAFDMYDLDGNGLISAKELHLVLKSLGERCSVQDCSRMIGPIDSDGDGYVNFEEFKKMMCAGVGCGSEGVEDAGEVISGGN
ncbi:hypothetical protein HPP92_023455 [Vanilla planifolia]|uniref:EF-hand domain-containing protein n=1 Tax=Vanilla planifolia TaxID=51239 RepID=A0A835PW53_VANPL|nr:hypothetical protein HPP92_023455 [Vanilla planifolia]